jgi:predicted N-acyltransferase
MGESNYVIRVATHPSELNARAWDDLLAVQSQPTPFMRHAYLAALHTSGSACESTGWAPHFLMLEAAGKLAAACVVYLKNHSQGEYVFDWAWASAYRQHGVPYYPKAVVAVPFTPVPGSRLLAVDAPARAALVQVLLAWCEQTGLSSLHLLFGADADLKSCAEAGLMLRHTVQFHWNNNAPGFRDFEDFLATLAQAKRKKIRQERRKVLDAGITFRHALGAHISEADWDFFYRCYERTYLEHGNPPYLSRDFFGEMARNMPENWLLFIAERNGQAVASSLIAVHENPVRAGGQNDSKMSKVAYGRYWGALETVDCLHFEACYYQPLQWCIANGYQRFEGGAQGEHKMARALLPVRTSSAHWIAHPEFAEAVARFLERESEGVGNYLEDLRQRSPLRTTNRSS